MVILAAVLSVFTGIDGCIWSIYDRAVRMDVAFWQFSNNPPNSTSVADSMMSIMILNSTCTGPFYGVIFIIGVFLLDFEPRKKYPPSLLHASVPDI